MRRADLYSQIPTEEAAICWARERGILSASRVCSSCGELMVEEGLARPDEKIWSCRRTVNGARHQIRESIRTGSIFAGSHLPITAIIGVLYEWSRCTPVDETAFQLALGKDAVSAWFAKFREIACWSIERSDQRRIGGDGTVVEIDECEIGRRKYHRGRLPCQRWVFGGVVRGTSGQSCFIDIVPNRQKRTLFPIIQARIAAGSTIMSDGAQVYRELPELGFRHFWVNHSENFVDPSNPAVHTQNIENLWKCLRKFLNKRSNYTRGHLESFIKEFIFRKISVDVFECILSAIEQRYSQ